MNFLRQLADSFSRWMDCVADTAVKLLGGIAGPRTVRLAEQENGTFSLVARRAKPARPADSVTISNGVATCSREMAATLKGVQVELWLRPEHFFFRPLELPQRASEFLDGIVRAQIDRITPWNANQAVAGWSKPVQASSDKISVTVAAAAREQIVPLAQAIERFGAKSIFVSTILPNAEAGSGAIRVFEYLAAGALEVRQIRRSLVAVLLITALLAGGAVASNIVIGGDLQARQNDIARRIAERRGIIRAGNDALTNSALGRLVRRKNQTPADVIILEALSKVLPDHTYVTELRIEGDKVQIVGITNDAPSLIRLIEESPHFSRATFFAPTTHAPSDPGDRFHIEARAKPVFLPSS
jgi:general secretion pathway protein L